MRESFLTVPAFAKKHGVSPQAIRYQIKLGNINPELRFGVIVISTKTKYKPRKQNKP